MSPLVLIPLLIVHVSLAIALFVPALLLPFALRPRRYGPPPETSGRVVRSLLWVQARGTLPIGIGVGLSGLALVGVLGVAVLGQPWLLVALAIYAVDLAIALFIQRPGFLRLGLLRRGDDPALAASARRQRYVSYLMAGLIGTIGFLMSTKPVLW
ncbi:MAG TPA: hypothetical protein VKR30_01480 [Candidatus Limnocylindrales bacterium]|nr:hypothetical protein [Candidatus Limnocylindrales bacterium]